ncbi:hypothetical protein [Paenibacillus polymyxa]|uniref:hypothetical protein n=1 Tax=Paenibacillus polymyxa TaxID=1406 RepID=UPI0023786605|nr:hypothetical protein [Paenibacillus polymyxa]WDM21280.1 hypothetical protein J4I02_20280 [Paenibacillus polymyxa]
MGQDYRQRFIKVIADEEECVFIVPTTLLKQTNISIGDKCVVIAEQKGLIIRKAEEGYST